MVCQNRVILSGEIRTTAIFDYEELTRRTIKHLGYITPNVGFSNEEVEVLNFIQAQSDDIHNCVDKEAELCYGDQGIMFGYATSETEDCYPLAISIANRLTETYTSLIESNNLLGRFYPDCKSQVTVSLSDNSINTILLAISHADSTSPDQIREFATTKLIPAALNKVKLRGSITALSLITPETKVLINTSGRFVIHGPASDTGVTGRKLAVDSYGGHARLGGGFICGKDSTKADNSLAKGLRYLAKHLIKTGLFSEIEIQAATAIGVPTPIALFVNSFGTSLSSHSDSEIGEILNKEIDLSLTSIIKMLDLSNSRTLKSASNGIFGRPFETFEDGTHCFSWESIDQALVEKLRTLLF
jgi:S-adenosylmethionine synthetase